MNGMYLAITGALAVWLAALSAFTFRKFRYLFTRQSKLAKEYGQFRQKEFNLMRIELEKQKRIVEHLQSLKDTPERLKFRFTSQFSEDLVLFEFFREQPSGFFVEAGAYDGVTFSNTYLLEVLGWTGLLVEPHPGLAKTCQSRRPNCFVEQKALGPEGACGTIEFTCADDASGGSPLSFTEATQNHIDRCVQEGYSLRKIQVEVASLNSMLEACSQRVDFLSLDIEGFELAALQGFDIARFSPAIMLIELNWDERDCNVKRYLDKYGYVVAGDVGCNRFFCRSCFESRLKEIITRFFPATV